MAEHETSRRAEVHAGIPAINMAMYRKIRFSVMDPAAVVEIPGAEGDRERVLIIRDIEVARARKEARANRVCCPADFTPPGGLSGDREIATAQSVAEFLRRSAVDAVVTDRSLPIVFAHFIEQVGIAVSCDPDLGVLERRAKTADEIAHLRDAQRVTEEAVRMACELIARADIGPDGALQIEGEVLTSEEVRTDVELFLREEGYDAPPSIIAGGPEGADCHDHGSGPLYTSQPIIVDIFPRNRDSLYNGDCTRTVVHGMVPPVVARMRDAVAAAKAAAIAAVRPGTTGEEIHGVTVRTLLAHGFDAGTPDLLSPDRCVMVHGTGHGVGLEVHEPPLLDLGGPPLVVGDVVTIEPGLYSPAIGGVRLEDMVVVTEDGCENLGMLPEGLSWG
jgi:Xaa-Pro aminopeptidase